MEQFVSTFTNKIDTKGRVSVPASFRAVLAKDSLDGIYCYPSLDAPALDAGGSRSTKKTNASFEALPPTLTSATILRRLCSAPVKSSPSTRTDARSFLSACASTPASPATSPSSVLAKSFRCGSPRASKLTSRRPAKRCATFANYSARGVAEAAGQREHGNDGGSRQKYVCRGRTGPPHARDALGGPRGT